MEPERPLKPDQVLRTTSRALRPLGPMPPAPPPRPNLGPMPEPQRKPKPERAPANEGRARADGSPEPAAPRRAREAKAAPAEVAATTVPPARGPSRGPWRGWALFGGTLALAIGWLALVAWRPGELWPLALPYAGCLALVVAPRFEPVRAARRSLLFALAAAAVWPVLAVVAELAGVVKAPSGLVIAITLGAIAAALGSLLVPSAREREGDDDGALSDSGRNKRAVGRYRLVRRLGQGGMGEVWRAQHDTLARPAALKLIKRTRLEDPELEQEILERFRREAEVTARLTSPHTVVLYDFGVTDEGVLYYAMELLEGQSVFALVELHGPVAEARVAFLLRHACHSLIEAHAAGLVHRDLKPENLFVARLGRDPDFLKVLDFGLVKELDADGAGANKKGARMHLTIAGARPGTPGFMAPEQISGSAPVDQRADVYALGCVAFYMLTGTPVFEGRVQAQVLFAHVGTEPDRPSARAKRPMHEGLEALVMRCLAKDPAARPTMEALDEALAALVFDAPWSQARARAWWVEAPLIAAARQAADI